MTRAHTPCNTRRNALVAVVMSGAVLFAGCAGQAVVPSSTTDARIGHALTVATTSAGESVAREIVALAAFDQSAPASVANITAAQGDMRGGATLTYGDADRDGIADGGQVTITTADGSACITLGQAPGTSPANVTAGAC